MNTYSKKILLEENEIPERWYNIIPDMPNKPKPMLHPVTKTPLTEEDLFEIFSEEAARQELNTTSSWIEIPEEVREMYKIWRPTPLVRAFGLEKALDTPAHIYFKNESVSPVGSHKLNSAIPQAYYCKKQGITNITTETGAGQWGAALSCCKAFWTIACRLHGKGFISPETIPTLNNADIRSRSHSLTEHVNEGW